MEFFPRRISQLEKNRDRVSLASESQMMCNLNTVLITGHSFVGLDCDLEALLLLADLGLRLCKEFF